MQTRRQRELQNPVLSGVTADGGYAEVMIAETRGIASIPDELSSAEAAPLLCAGVTTYKALRNAGLRGGDLVARQGIGGLGHLGIQFARQMGFRTAAIGRGRDKQDLAKDLGAHLYIDAAVDDAAAVLQRVGGARAILATGTSGEAMGRLHSGVNVSPEMAVPDQGFRTFLIWHEWDHVAYVAFGPFGPLESLRII